MEDRVEDRVEDQVRGQVRDQVEEESERPTTSTRDYAELGVRLAAWLRSLLGASARPAVSQLEVPAANGMSSETVLFDVTTTEDGVKVTLPCAARLAPEATAVPVFREYDLDKQFRAMRLVADRTEVPVPEALWFEPDAAALGSAFLVMRRIDGRVPPDLAPYNFGSWLSEASPEEQGSLQDASVGVLAGLHEITTSNADLGFLELDRPEPTALRRHVADHWVYYEWVSGEWRQPLIERCFAWLEDNWPADEGPPVLSWGDARIGNILYDGFRPVGVLDWEMAGVGPREIDVGWMIFLHRFFEDLASALGLPGMPQFMRRDDVAATYERLSGHTPRDLDWYTMYAALRHGIIMSRIRLRSVYFGEAELPDDPDDLIMHRATLEAMLDGTYWDALAG